MSSVARSMRRHTKKREKILGLNLIVGSGESEELKRCMESMKGPLFDEIVITHATREKDPKVLEVAEQYADVVGFFEWCDDFSAARNYSFSLSTTPHIMWVDADDVLKEPEYKKLLELKPKVVNYEMILLDYVYSHDANDNPQLILPRERIVKKCDHIRWHDPIHEYMNMNLPHDKMMRTKIRLDHYRTKAFDPNRNIDMLKKVYDSGKASERIKFYYGKELADCGYMDRSIPVLEEYIKTGDDFRDNLTVACIRVSKYYYDNKNYDLAKTYAFKGVRFNEIYAENFVTLGTIFELEKDYETAIKYFKEALTKKLDGGMSQIVDFYGFIPSAKLALLYFNKKEYEKSLEYCDKALEYKADNAQMLELKKTLSNELEMQQKGNTLPKEDISKIKKYFKNKNFSFEILKNNSNHADIRIKKIRRLKVIWMIPHTDLTNPSIRIRRYNVSQKMNTLGVESTIITDYSNKNIFEIRNEIGDASVVIFTQYGQHELQIMKYIKPLGIKCVFDHCEALFRYPYEDDCMKEADVISCCSTKLEELTHRYGHGNTVVLKDAIEERYPSEKHVYEDRYERPKAIYMGMGGNSFLVTEWLKDTIQEAGYELVVCTEWDNATIKWDEKTWPDEMNKCDVVLCPQRVDVQPAKSSVKVTTAMALGIPVIASPLQAYKEIIVQGKNGYLADTKEEWKKALEKLKNPKLREKIGKAGKRSIKDYTLEDITKKWISSLEDLINNKLEFKQIEVQEQPQSRPMVDLIIANYNNVNYLKLLINSILLNTLHPFHIIISDAGSNDETWSYLKTLKGMTILGEPGKRLTFSEACNAGIKVCNTKYFVVMNSDLIVSKGWLTNLVNKMENTDRLAACGPLSNCDRGWLHDDPRRPDSPKYPMKLQKSGIELVPGMKYELMEPHIEELYEFMQESNKKNDKKYVQQKWIAAYCTIFAKCAIDEVGLYDTIYKNGCEDLDLCDRLSKFGYRIGQAIDSFVFHFGGVSRGAYQNENKEQYDKEDYENHIKFKRKWDRERVVIWTGPAWEPWNKQKVDEGMAGSETWASYLAREFVKLGYRTTIYNDLLASDKTQTVRDPVRIGGELKGEVLYRDYTQMQEDLKYDIVDYFIASRSTEPLKINIHSLRNYVMIHDVWLNMDKNYDIMAWRVQGYGYLSEWHKQFLIQHHKMPEHKMFLTSNGLTPPDGWLDVDKYEKKNQTVYSSSPDRGLYQLLMMMPEIRKEVPDFQLVICYGFYNWEQSAIARKDERSIDLINKIKVMTNQPGVIYKDRVDKVTLAHFQKESKVWLYPTWFVETQAITAIENGHAKNAILTTDLGGLKTTVADAGILLPPNGLSRDGQYPQEYTDKFVAEAVKLLKDEEYRKEWAKKAYDKMQEYSWERIAKKWLEAFKM